jgi:hypothetical protein
MLLNATCEPSFKVIFEAGIILMILKASVQNPKIGESNMTPNIRSKE